ncbi:hypothetical protein [Litorimonas sp. WD9-15]|uniref:hypothetical protein n=1 Tax=Litorimonas sp. WD9-15 TaxID=3418716 RepID=UPI003D07E9AF
MTDCATLKLQLDQARQALHDSRLNLTPAEIQDGPDRSRWNVTKTSDIQKQILELERQFEAGNCAVLLNQTPTRRVSRGPLRGPIGRR